MSASGVQRLSFLVHGRVQGVCYRQFTKDAAVERKLTGWVRNTDNEKVEGEVQGASDIVKGFVKELHKGPKHARVDKVDTKELDSIDGENGFEIRRP
ncbi:Acylphosphatase [Ascobolus immersus RN42]|uniref:acylphosphatase n=1 Tax=Ascobolus immersus RN42 TaxID=1160509 RepID=A0A3N4I571_ASCIM|nr:Acylphosphatase [Ascobolus immersus RN42]